RGHRRGAGRQGDDVRRHLPGPARRGGRRAGVRRPGRPAGARPGPATDPPGARAAMIASYLAAPDPGGIYTDPFWHWVIVVVAALLAWAVIPVGIWYGFSYWIANLNIGILFILAVSSMNAYAILLGGWSSNNKYSLLGGLRAAAQLISYEMALGLSLVPIFMIVGSLRLQDISTYLVPVGPVGLPLIVVAPVSFLIYIISAVAETNRTPFDLPEAEQELIGGYLTEYSGLKFTAFYLGEYVNMITVAAL